MKRPKNTAHTNDVMPWSKAGGRRGTRAILVHRKDGGPRLALPDQKKFTEPVALLSTSPVNLRLPPTALGSGFDLLALRARCKRELRARVEPVQGASTGVCCNLRR